MDFFDPYRYFRQLDARRTEAPPGVGHDDQERDARRPGDPLPAADREQRAGGDGIAAIANALRTARTRAGLSQRELGQRAGVPQSHISKIESGAVDLRLSSLLEIARVLRLDVRLEPAAADPFDVVPLRGRAAR